MNRLNILVVFGLLNVCNCVAQAPAIQRQKRLGGTGLDAAMAIQQTTGKRYILAGATTHNKGDVIGNYGNYDYRAVKLSGSGIKTELKWDNSFPEQTTSVRGVAADGVSRIYLKVSTDNTPSIQDVNVILSDGINSGSSMLGKVQMANTINTYSTEANNANSISATSSTSQNGDFWFWYVAPDDFSDNENSTFANATEREVKAHVVATFTDGTKDSADVPIKIVRPPLVMVHGLAGNEHSWDYFKYGNGNTLFINSPLFIQKKAIRLLPHSSFLLNAQVLLSPDGTASTTTVNRLNTLQGNIEEIRKKGYACNQVDYVCHSMGGCILRTAINVLPNKFYGASNEFYKSYGKGFVHKAIIISTPHNSSPIADAVGEFIPKAPDYINYFLKKFNDNFPNSGLGEYIERRQIDTNNYTWQPTPAVVNLQVSSLAGGINFDVTSVRHHLIAGDVDIDMNNLNAIINYSNFNKAEIELFNHILKIMRDNSQGNSKVFLQTLLEEGDKRIRVLRFLEWYSPQLGYPNFLEDGDILVALSSELAGLPVNSTNVTVFHNIFPLDAQHTNIKNRTDVGNRVKNLLNSASNSNLFGITIPATPVSIGDRTSFQQLAQQVANRFETSFYDTSKIKIISPVANTTCFADSIQTIKINVKDTFGLAYIDVAFQGSTYTSVSHNTIQTFIVKVDPSFLGNMSISATAIYDRVNGTDYYTDTIGINVGTNATLIGFTAKEDTNYIQKEYPFYPTCTARYTNYYADIPANSPDLIVTVSNPSIVQYNTTEHAFYALADTGRANAIINYKGFKDTIAFVLLPSLYSGCVNRTTGNTTLKSIVNWSRSVVPATCDSVVVMPGHTLMIDSSIQIRSLYISPGATVLIQDSTIKLQIGEADAGSQSLTNYGNLTITKGTIAINGSLQLMAGSNFTMTDGELVLDANTGYSSTSLPNGKNILDVSGTINSFSFTGGTLQIIDPPLWSTSQSINCPYNFGDNTTLEFGNGISQTASNNPNGFGGNLLPAKIGKLILDAATPNNNRIFVNLNPLTVKSSVQVKSGNLVQKALIQVIQ